MHDDSYVGLPCTVCNKKFHTPSSLQRHMVRTDECDPLFANNESYPFVYRNITVTKRSTFVISVGLLINKMVHWDGIKGMKFYNLKSTLFLKIKIAVFIFLNRNHDEAFKFVCQICGKVRKRMKANNEKILIQKIEKAIHCFFYILAICHSPVSQNSRRNSQRYILLRV